MSDALKFGTIGNGGSGAVDGSNGAGSTAHYNGFIAGISQVVHCRLQDESALYKALHDLRVDKAYWQNVVACLQKNYGYHFTELDLWDPIYTNEIETYCKLIKKLTDSGAFRETAMDELGIDRSYWQDCEKFMDAKGMY